MDFFLKKNIVGTPFKELMNLFNKEFHTNISVTILRNRCYKLKLKNYVTYSRDFGSEIITKDGIYIKSVNRRWISKARNIFERTYGALKRNQIVIFADGNINNFELDNLIAITRNENGFINKRKLRFKNAFSTKSGVLLARLLIKIKERQHDLRENHNENAQTKAEDA